MMKKISVLISVLFIIFSVQAISFAWTGPTLTPPYGNLTAPLNLSGTVQSKTGGLNIATESGFVGIGTTNPGYKLDVNGTGSFTSVRNANFTSGTVLFTGTDGVISQDTSNLRWDNTNKRLGIGTVSPNATLHLKTASGNAELDIQSASSPYWGVYQDDATDDLRFWNTDNRVTFTDSGDVGIGTASPNGKLQVGANLNDANGSISGATTPTRLIVNSATSPALTLGYWSSGYGLDMWVGTGGLAPIYFDQRNNDSIIFRVKTASAPVEVMRLSTYNSSVYNVGIGTSAPGEKLHVVGNMKIDGNTGTYPVLTLTDSTAGGSGWAFISGFPNTGDLTFRETGVANHVVVKKTTGNVGIGTSAPASKLDVVGTTTSSTGFKITTAGNGIQFADGSIQTTAPGANSLTLGNTFVGNVSNVAVATTTLYINTASRVGIGTANPEAKLAIAGLPTSPGTIYKNHLQILDTTPQTTGVGGSISFLGNYSGTSMIDVGSGIGGYKTNSSGSVPAALDFGLNFWTRGAVSGVHSSMFITGEGGVGIGRMDVDPAYGITTNSLTGGIKSDTATTTPAGFYSNSIGPALVTNVGNVGIGTATPAAKLDTAGTIRSTAETAPASGVGLEMFYSTLGRIASYNRTSSAYVPLQIDGSTLSLNYNSSGNVGIGTTAPTGSKLMIVSPNDQAGITMHNTFDNNKWSIRTGTVGVNNKGLAFVDDINVATRIQITDSGNVGIGTASPDARLTIQGADNNTGGFTIRNNAGSNIGAIYGDGGNLYIQGYRYATDKLYLGTINNSQTITLNAGNVGIGTTNLTAINATAGLFSSVTPKTEILTGSGSGTYKEAVVIRHNSIGVTAVSRELGLLLKASDESGANADESNKMSGMMWWSNSSYGNSGNLSLVHANNKVLTSDFSGNIGIGTTVPGAKLEVNGTIKISGGTPGAGKVLTSDASGLASWTTPTSGLGGSGTINKIAKFTAGTTVGDSQIYDNGTNVGIGTTAPTAKLDIAGTYSTSINPSYAGYQEIPAGTNFYTGSGNLSFLAKETAGLKTSIVYYGAPNYYSALEVANTASGLGNLLLMKSGGNVGIGTTAPGNLLTVNGTIQGSTLYATTQIGASSVTADYLSGSSPLNLYSGGSSYMAFSTNGEKVRILNNGNVGIGTTNPSYQLHIANSSATATFALVGGAGQAGVLYIGANGSIDTALGEAAAAGQIVITSALYDTVLKSGSTQNILFGIGTAEKMRITSAGNVGIGVTNPDSTYKLVTVGGGIKTKGNTSDSSQYALYAENSLGTNLLSVRNDGNVGIGTTAPAYKLDVSGSIQATAFYYSSDKNLKNNIKPLSGSLDKILQLQGVSFNWKNDNSPSIGVIAQDVEKIYPELVSTNKENGLKSVEYANLVAPLIESVKEQQKQIEELKAEILDLKLRIK